jgi:hypothetical protein
VEQGRDPKVAFRDERLVVHPLGRGDGGSETFDRLVMAALVVAYERCQHERHLNLERRIFGQARQSLRLGQPMVRLRGPALPLVDVT